MRNFVDLHVHSNASDGELSPAEAVAMAERKRLAAVALTDHDTMAGLPQAEPAARGLSLRLIPGIEISAQFTGGTLHILGLGVRVGAGRLEDMLAGLRRQRALRNPRMLDKLRALGIKITMDELAELAGGHSDAVIGRLHMARLLVDKGHARDIGDAFDRFLGEKAPAFVDKERLSPRAAIEGVHAGGGLAILAHPVQLNYGNAARLERIVADLAYAGLDGIEVYHSLHSLQQTRLLLDLARRRRLLISGGSDFHGSGKLEALMGRPRVPLAAVKELLERLGCTD